ncbi:MAG TPA: hypothetical protein VJA21_24225 [Verrucomicrobiae bacterium]
MSAVRTFNAEARRPALDEVRRLVVAEIKKAKGEGAKVLNVSTSSAAKTREFSISHCSEKRSLRASALFMLAADSKEKIAEIL